EGTRGGPHRGRGGGRRRRPGLRPRPGGRGGDGRGGGGVRLGQALLRIDRRPAPAGGPARGDPGRPRAPPRLPRPPLARRRLYEAHVGSGAAMAPGVSASDLTTYTSHGSPPGPCTQTLSWRA